MSPRESDTAALAIQHIAAYSDDNIDIDGDDANQGSKTRSKAARFSLNKKIKLDGDNTDFSQFPMSTSTLKKMKKMKIVNSMTISQASKNLDICSNGARKEITVSFDMFH